MKSEYMDLLMRIQVLIPVTVGFLFILLWMLQRVLIPREPNFWIGYRTRASMKNSDTWQLANRISMAWMLRMGIFLWIMAFIGTRIDMDPGIGAAYAAGGVLLSVIIIIGCTEAYMSEVFDSTGRRKQLRQV